MNMGWTLNVARRQLGWLCWGLLAGCCLLSGCNSGTYQSAPVNGDVARDTLEEVLDAWKAGKSVESLKAEDPPITVQDLDWSGGATLLSYEVLDNTSEKSANLMAKVKLSLKDKEGNESEKEVTYVVGTAPVLTVIRNIMR